MQTPPWFSAVVLPHVILLPVGRVGAGRFQSAPTRTMRHPQTNIQLRRWTSSKDDRHRPLRVETGPQFSGIARQGEPLRRWRRSTGSNHSAQSHTVYPSRSIRPSNKRPVHLKAQGCPDCNSGLSDHGWDSSDTRGSNAGIHGSGKRGPAAAESDRAAQPSAQSTTDGRDAECRCSTGC
jgi:hypothetical protein